MKKTNSPFGGKRLVDAAMETAQEKKAEKPVIVDMKKYPVTADWFLICEGDNIVHTRAIAEAIMENIESQGATPWHKEGLEQGRWILLDYSDVIIHIMLPEIRAYYKLENIAEHCSGTERSVRDGKFIDF